MASQFLARLADHPARRLEDLPLVPESAPAASSGLTIHSFTHRDRGVHRTDTNQEADV
jgi:hypothetical protein